MSYEVTNEQLKDHFRDALRDAEDLVKATAELGDEGISTARAKARQSLGLAKAKLAEGQDAVILRVRGAANATDTFVRQSPWEAIGVAAGLGVLVGVLLSRR